MELTPPLPPGQHAQADFPRFGLFEFAARIADPQATALVVCGDTQTATTVPLPLPPELPRVEQTSDIHCVTTWSKRGVCWSGVRFADFYEHVVLPQARPLGGATLVALRGQDAYVTTLPLDDLLAPDVLLADHLDGAPLGLAHGAPLRVVAPRHYGYKSAKHLYAIEFWRDARAFRTAAFGFMDHPRARVALEERARYLPGALLRPFYRSLIGLARWRFRTALERHPRGL